MFETTVVRIHPATREAVLRMLQASADGRDLNAVIEQALQTWLLARVNEDPRAAEAAQRGYQWKSLFLPEGTRLRFEYKSIVYNAQVRGNDIVFQGRAYSPRQWLLHLTGTVRNAWRELWLRAPGDQRWHLADTRRHILRRSPRGRHPRGEDTVRPTARGAGPATDAPTAGCCSCGARYIAYNLTDYDRMRSMLYRDDLVRDDQPDLTCRQGGGGRTRAGRAGPRDRRYSNASMAG